MGHPHPHYLITKDDLERIDRMTEIVARFVTELIVSRQLPDPRDDSRGLDEFEAHIESLIRESELERQMEFNWAGRGSIDF